MQLRGIRSADGQQYVWIFVPEIGPDKLPFPVGNPDWIVVVDPPINVSLVRTLMMERLKESRGSRCRTGSSWIELEQMAFHFVR